MRRLLELIASIVVPRAEGANARAILLFAGVLALDGADASAVGAMAAPLQQAFHIGKTELGLLLTCSLGVGAAATLPFGWIVDRAPRVRLLTWMIVTWGVAIALCGCATSYTFLLVARIFLGGVTACAGPAIASLIGDEFEPGARGRVYGHVLSGELVGSGLGFLVSGELANWSWRAGFLALAVPVGLLAWAIRRLPEPDRRAAGDGGARGQRPKSAERIQQLIEQRHVPPRKNLVLDGPPRGRSLWWALAYVVRIPTNLVLIIASALAYFYFTGLRAFGVEYFHAWFGISHAVSVVVIIVVGAGALGGVLVTGALADRLLDRGHLRARVVVAVVAYGACAVLFLLALLTRSLWVGLPLLAGAAAALGGISPPLDAARLDIMHPGLWGRAEAVRTFLRKSGEALAPLTFGYLAEHAFGGRGASSLHDTFLAMSVALFAGAGIAWIALRTYPRDVATADTSIRRTGSRA
ncbi:MAG TPA: MFS transporter [Vicinamibacterales bacterium]|nr:MFS transporter [Vicinamibacterales bacterium]